jgi:hypothetical protein
MYLFSTVYQILLIVSISMRVIHMIPSFLLLYSTWEVWNGHFTLFLELIELWALNLWSMYMYMSNEPVSNAFWIVLYLLGDTARSLFLDRPYLRGRSCSRSLARSSFRQVLGTGQDSDPLHLHFTGNCDHHLLHSRHFELLDLAKGSGTGHSGTEAIERILLKSDASFFV